MRRDAVCSEDGQSQTFAAQLARWLAAPIAALCLAACGGGGATSAGEQAVSAGAGVNAKALSTTERNAPVPAAAVQPLSPADPRWATITPCTADSDFVAITTNVNYLAPLLSRHVGCALMVGDIGANEAQPTDSPITVELMRNADDTAWEFYKRASGRNPVSFTAGYLKLKTQWQVHGAPGGLFKNFTTKTWIDKWVWDSSFPLGTPGMSIKLSPQYICSLDSSVPAGFEVQPCGAPLGALEKTLQLSSGSGSGDAGRNFTINFAWSRDGSVATRPDMLTFRVAPDAFRYVVEQADLPTNGSPRAISTFSRNGSYFDVLIRCDRNPEGSPQGNGGCVMPAAAAVFVMDSSLRFGSKVIEREAAIHVRDAQTVGQSGMSGLAPGVYAPRAGTRAVADIRFDLPYSPLHYVSNSSDQNANTEAACTGPTSLIVTRPYTGSDSCPETAGSECSCDEYPFKATNNGAATNPGTTSVRKVLAKQNSYAGSLYGAFLQKQRVLSVDFASGESDAFWVYVK